MNVENILSIDLEDWYHICGIKEWINEDSWPHLESRIVINALKILEVLSQKKIKATFFILGFVAEKHPDLIKEIKSAGHEIASHGYAHKRVYTMTPDTFRRDLNKATEIIHKITGCSVKGYRAPEWSIRNDSLWALDILLQEGFEYDSSMSPLPVIGNSEYSTIPHKLKLDKGCLWEFPPFVGETPLVNLPLGGGWGLRIFPYTLIRSFIRKLNNMGQPAIIYIHPRELDSDNPRIKLPTAKKFVLYARVESTEKRIHRLLKDFSFTSISNVLQKYCKENIPFEQLNCPKGLI